MTRQAQGHGVGYGVLRRRRVALRFLHCSDIHLLSLEGVHPLRFLNKRATGGVNLLLKRRKGHDGVLFDDIVEHAKELEVDRLVIAGDRTNLALESEFELVREVLDGCGLPVTVIPGNHDTYTRGSAKKKRFESFLHQHMQGETVDDFFYPFVQRYGKVSLIGVSSAVPTRPMSAVGRVGPAQLERLARALEEKRSYAGTHWLKFRGPLEHRAAPPKRLSQPGGGLPTKSRRSVPTARPRRGHR